MCNNISSKLQKTLSSVDSEVLTIKVGYRFWIRLTTYASKNSV